MNERCRHLIRRLKAAQQKTEAFFADLQAEDWHRQVYTDGAAWSVQQVLAHFVMSEDSMARLVAGVVAGGEGVPEDFDLDAYNEYKAKQLADATPEVLLARFDDARQATIELVASFDDADLEKQGRHPWLGTTKIEDIVKLIYRHNTIHQREIRAALSET